MPITRDAAVAFVDHVHRHHRRPQGYRFAVGVANETDLVGVAMAGRPVARALDDGRTIEVTRVATDGTYNACSMLYGACWRAARALGYTHAVTYTQADESGASLRAVGWTRAAVLPPRSGWDSPSRRRGDRGTDGVLRVRWEISA
ncbi:XF1762 family protein [Actinoplanes ianthinogenes]|uniref:XF1762 family protein n=1 Tax=Actinoplanes ianthinogenes TaxID=122358 RepID=UPI003145550E